MMGKVGCSKILRDSHICPRKYKTMLWQGFTNFVKVGAESFLISSANDENMLAGKTLISR